jgi:hypothetical protein
MSEFKLMQLISKTTRALQSAREAGDEDLIADLEDELYELEGELEDLQHYEAEENGNHRWN